MVISEWEYVFLMNEPFLGFFVHDLGAKPYMKPEREVIFSEKIFFEV